MRFLKRLFSSREPSKEIDFDWILLNDLQQLDEIITYSYEKTIVIFKHSTRCSISRFVLKRFEDDFYFPTEEIKSFYLDLLAHRDISNEIARRFEVEHQSPQIIVVKNGRAVYVASHESIHAGILERFV